MRKLPVWLVLVSVMGTLASAQVPQMINFQGRVVVSGTNYHGSGQFKFALVDGTGASSFWSNDGTSTGGGEPAAATTLPCNKGLFSVALGDGALGMSPIMPNVFSNGDIRIRTWFNHGSGFHLLSPDQRVVSVGYAMVAGAVQLPSNTYWEVSGNAGTSAGTHFLGTSDDEPMEIHVNGRRALRLEPHPHGANVIGGHPSNSVASAVKAATIAGGGGFVEAPAQGSVFANHVASDFGTVGGGAGNTASGLGSTVAGGVANQAAIQTATVSGGARNTASGLAATVSGGVDNSAFELGATVGGGDENTASNIHATIAGGYLNTARGHSSSIGGGRENSTSNIYSTVAGGWDNAALGSVSTVAGGWQNTNLGYAATIGGGSQNSATGFAATVPGGWDNMAAGEVSFAAGQQARAEHDGAFVWADSQQKDLSSTGEDQFLIRARGGVGIGTDSPTHALTVADEDSGYSIRLIGPSSYGHGGGLYFGDSNYVYLAESTDDELRIQADRVGVGRDATANRLEVEGNASKTTAGSWLANSDARIKTEIQEIRNPLDMISRLCPVTFRYREEYRSAHPSIEDRPYYNFVAQEFREVFPHAVKPDGTGLLQVDTYPLRPVLVGAVQELNEIISKKDARIDELERRLGQLEEAMQREYAPRVE